MFEEQKCLMLKNAGVFYTEHSYFVEDYSGTLKVLVDCYLLFKC